MHNCRGVVVVDWPNLLRAVFRLGEERRYFVVCACETPFRGALLVPPELPPLRSKLATFLYDVGIPQSTNSKHYKATVGKNDCEEYADEGQVVDVLLVRWHTIETIAVGYVAGIDIRIPFDGFGFNVC